MVVENVDVTQLRICPEVPPASDHQRLSLAKKAASGSVYKILNKKKTSKKDRPRLSCKIEGCTEQSYGRSGLYRHYSYAHFKEDILGLIGESQENCPYCGLKFQRSNDAVGHVGCVHNKLEDFLPKRLHIKSNVVKKSSKPKAKTASSSGRLQPAKKPDRAKTVSDFRCGLCEKKKFSSRNNLYEHYSLVHYRDQLRPFINEESEQCNRCKIIHKNPTEANKIRHMGVVHGLLENKNILPSHLRIPKVGKAVRKGKESVEKAFPGNKDLTKKPPKKINSENIRKVRSCHLCPYQIRSRSKLYGHYSIR